MKERIGWLLLVMVTLIMGILTRYPALIPLGLMVIFVGVYRHKIHQHQENEIRRLMALHIMQIDTPLLTAKTRVDAVYSLERLLNEIRGHVTGREWSRLEDTAHSKAHIAAKSEALDR